MDRPYQQADEVISLINKKLDLTDPGSSGIHKVFKDMDDTDRLAKLNFIRTISTHCDMLSSVLHRTDPAPMIED